MRRFVPQLVAVCLAPLCARADENNLLSYWVQLAPGGGTEARAVVSGTACPLVVSFKDTAAEQRADIAMQPRAAASADFPLVCSAPVPADTDTAWAAMSKEEGDARQFILRHAARSRARAVYDMDRALPLLRPDPERILVLGDTGCRLKGTAVQACNDPVQWPFAGLAQGAAKWWPDLIVHLGDYLYRESPCPDGNAGCAGSPYGDNWASWNADFFAPGKPLLSAAPFVIVRGNHEDCGRSGPGFLRLLGSGAFDPNAACATHVAPYSIALDRLNLVVMDNADAPDTSIDPSVVPEYQSEFASLKGAPANTWLVMHRPVWGAISGPLGIPTGGNQTMIAALNGQPLAGPELMLAGHIHSFEAINYQSKAPPLIVAGHGGDDLDEVPDDLDGAVLAGIKVKDGVSVPGFGFLLMTREGKGWKIELFDDKGVYERECKFTGGRVDCPPPSK